MTLVVLLLGCVSILSIQAVIRGWRSASERERLGLGEPLDDDAEWVASRACFTRRPGAGPGGRTERSVATPRPHQRSVGQVRPRRARPCGRLPKLSDRGYLRAEPGLVVAFSGRRVGGRREIGPCRLAVGTPVWFWPDCDGLKWTHPLPAVTGRVPACQSTVRRSPTRWVPEWSCSKGSAGLESPRGCRTDRPTEPCKRGVRSRYRRRCGQERPGPSPVSPAPIYPLFRCRARALRRGASRGGGYKRRLQTSSANPRIEHNT